VSPSPPDKKPTAVLIRRYIARLIDLVVYWVALAIPFLLMADQKTLAEANVNPDSYDKYGSFALGADRVFRADDKLFIFERKELFIIAGIAAGVALIFELITQGRFGWTVGKLLTGLRTVNREGVRPGIVRAFFRTVLLALDALPGYVIPLVGGIFALASADNRRLGDYAGGTYVVGRNSMGEDPTGEHDDLTASSWDTLDEHPGHVTKLDEGEPLRVGEAAAATTAVAAATGRDDRPVTDDERPAYQPQWDPARKAYLQWDPRKQTWLQFDDDSGEWQPIG
jgi:uncharacterized RDD family membrane protein YckC